MKKLLFIALVLFSIQSFAQVTPVYDEKIDAMEQINQTVKQAKEEGKHVLVQVGGNWCKWCIKLHDWIDESLVVKNSIAKDYIYINVNSSKAKPNEEAMKYLRNPGRLAYPSLHIIDQEGNVIQSMAVRYLQSDDKFDEQKFKNFLKDFTPTAIKY